MTAPATASAEDTAARLPHMSSAGLDMLIDRLGRHLAAADRDRADAAALLAVAAAERDRRTALTGH